MTSQMRNRIAQLEARIEQLEQEKKALKKRNAQLWWKVLQDITIDERIKYIDHNGIYEKKIIPYIVKLKDFNRRKQVAWKIMQTYYVATCNRKRKLIKNDRIIRPKMARIRKITKIGTFFNTRTTK